MASLPSNNVLSAVLPAGNIPALFKVFPESPWGYDDVTHVLTIHSEQTQGQLDAAIAGINTSEVALGECQEEAVRALHGYYTQMCKGYGWKATMAGNPNVRIPFDDRTLGVLRECATNVLFAPKDVSVVDTEGLVFYIPTEVIVDAYQFYAADFVAKWEVCMTGVQTIRESGTSEDVVLQLASFRSQLWSN